ncbi:MAG: MATE family efflux transporter [Phycisphaeraceae bacterium]|nr:MATE family efflux transporter [Phycisphaeraceae bacterium]
MSDHNKSPHESHQGGSPALNPESIDPSEELTLSPARTRPSGLTSDGRLRAGRLAGLTMRQAIWILSWPILAESFLNSMVGLTDTVLAAGLGEQETDAIGAAAYMMWLMGLVVMSVGMGATALIARSVGARRMAVANAVLGQSLVVAIVAGVATGLIVAITTPATASMMNLSGDGATAFRDYILIVSCGMPLMSILFTGIACARGVGDSIRPLWIMVVVNAVNIVVSWILSGVDWNTLSSDGTRSVVLANPFPFELGIKGIALGTIASQAVGAVMVLWMASRGTWGIRLRARRLRPHWHTIRRIVRIGLPNLFETFGMWIGNYAIMLFVGLIGAAGVSGAMGAHIVAIRIEAFSFLPGFAMGAAAATLTGQYLGAGSPAMARKAIWICTLIACTTMGLSGLFFVIFPRLITSLFTPIESHLTLVPALLIISGCVQIPFAASIVWRSALRGAGDVKAVMHLTWWTTYAVRLPLAYLLSGVEIPLPGGRILPNPSGMEPSLAWLWVGLCAEIVVRAGAFGWRFLRGGWERGRI